MYFIFLSYGGPPNLAGAEPGVTYTLTLFFFDGSAISSCYRATSALGNDFSMNKICSYMTE